MTTPGPKLLNSANKMLSVRGSEALHTDQTALLSCLTVLLKTFDCFCFRTYLWTNVCVFKHDPEFQECQWDKIKIMVHHTLQNLKTAMNERFGLMKSLLTSPRATEEHITRHVRKSIGRGHHLGVLKNVWLTVQIRRESILFFTHRLSSRLFPCPRLWRTQHPYLLTYFLQNKPNPLFQIWSRQHPANNSEIEYGTLGMQ